MELQLPLILFSLFISWSAGLYATQSIYALRSDGRSNQMASVVVSFALMVIGGVSVFFHLEHWERIFNGFGHITSGITQELIAIVVLFVCMVIAFFILRKPEGRMPKWLAAVNIVVAVVLVFVMGHSYMMASRPTWDSLLQVLSLLGNACVLGPATFLLLRKPEEGPSNDKLGDLLALAGSAVNLVTTVVFVVAMSVAGGAFSQVDRYFDGIHAAEKVLEASSYSPFGASAAMTVVAIAAALCAVVFAYLMRKREDKKPFVAIALACGVISATALRMVMFATGGSIFMYY